jgi:hypothetical protein
MKALSRLASPGGFALVLLLFLFLPFMSVSCDVGEFGSIGADYNGAELATGTRPDVEVPSGLEDMLSELPGSDDSREPAPDPGVQVLAIILGLVLLAGIALPFVPRLAHQVRLRMFGGAALAALAGVLMVVIQVVAQSSLADQLTDDASDYSPDQPLSADDLADRLIHSEVGFWLALVVLFVIALASVGYVYREKLFPKPVHAGAAVSTSAPIWRAESPEPDQPEPTEQPPPTGPSAPTEPPAPVGPAAPAEPPAPAGPEAPPEPPAPTERPG